MLRHALPRIDEHLFRLRLLVAFLSLPTLENELSRPYTAWSCRSESNLIGNLAVVGNLLACITWREPGDGVIATLGGWII